MKEQGLKEVVVERIAIIGTGLIGTSIGLALKAAKVKAEVVGHDRDNSNATKAQKKGALDKTFRSLRDAVDNASLVIVATPVSAMPEVFDLISDYLPQGCVVTDTGSTKAAVLQWAEEALPRSVNFVGGHPMAGKELAGPDAAEATLFQGRSYCVIPGKRASQEAVETVVQLAKALGAKPYFMDAGEHDSYVAAVSHLPMVLSTALVACTSKSPGWEDMAQLAATGYRDTTRLASGDPIMHRDICRTNSQFIAYWIDAFINELSLMRDAILKSENGDTLKELFSNARAVRELWLEGKVKPGMKAIRYPEISSSLGEQVGELIFGRKLMEAQKRLFDRYEKKDGEDGNNKKDKW